ncbi:PLP-dependent decarboxylase, partial [Burkholderia pseudomallei]
LGTRLVVSLKANSHADLVLRCAHAIEDGIELASQGELDTVVGRGNHVKYLNNPAMGDALMLAGIASRCHFILDGPDMV